MNAAFDEARSLGVIDTFLSMPSADADLARKYDWVRAGTMDPGSREMTMPAEYMFKGVPRFGEEVADPVTVVLALMDHFGIEKMLVGWDEGNVAQRALKEHPDRFFGMATPNPNIGMEGVRRLERAIRDHGLACAHVWGAGLVPQVPLNDKRMYPIYAKCVELGVPVVVYAGVPGPRVPMRALDVTLIDEVCWFFPELKIVLRHGAEPDTDLAVKLMLKWPNLYYSTSAFAPKYYPADIVDYANTRGADKILYAGYFSAGLGLGRIFEELPHVPFRDHVWPKFLRENALRVFDLE